MTTKRTVWNGAGARPERRTTQQEDLNEWRRFPRARKEKYVVHDLMEGESLVPKSVMKKVYSAIYYG